MRWHETPVTVRFNEVDSYGVAWHGNFIIWLEVGRNELARQFGLAAEQLAEAGFLGPVINLELKYVRPARYNEKLTVRTTVRRALTATLEFRAEIVGENGKVCARGLTVHALTDLAGVTQYQLPAPIADRFARLLDWAESPA